MKVGWPGILLLAGVAAPAAGEAPDCAAIEDPDARLACYDHAAGRTPAPATLPQPSPAPAPDSGEDLAPRAESGPLPHGEYREEPEPQAFDARITGPFDGWKRGQLFWLDNGQAWEVTESGDGYYPGIADQPRVRLEPGLLGSWWMRVDGVSRRIRVRRAK